VDQRLGTERLSPEASAPCPHCASSAQFSFRARDLNLRVSETYFSYFQCPSCRLIFMAQAPADLARYYPSGYYTLPENRHRLELVSSREQFKLDLIRPYRTGDRLLELGPAWGSFAYAAKSAGYDVTVVEVDERCCRYLRDVVGVTVHRPDESGALPQGLGQYDVVAMWHVIEHVQNFERELIQLAGLVRPGGTLAIASPNPNAWQFRVMRARWPHVDAPRHLQLIPPEVIIDILSAHNFEIMLATCNDVGGLRWNRFGWQRVIVNALPRARGATALGIALGAAISEIALPFDRRKLQGAAYTLILKKSLPSNPADSA
jgi:SAM-dependent methyltransferase